MNDRTDHTQDGVLNEALNWDHKSRTNSFLFNPTFWVIPLFIWSLLVGLSFFYNVSQINQFATTDAANKGRFIFQMIEDVRLWNARHGGVYVKTSKTSPSNPYLNDSDKDVKTNLGQNLTKVNPAYMTRQIANIVTEHSNTVINITSLKPLNPNNLADNWERKALTTFEEGNSEDYDFLTIGQVNLFRYMSPLMVENACLECHAHQGYKVGDVRGGISITFDATPYLETKKQQVINQTIVHGSAWFILTILSLLGLYKLRQQVIFLKTINEEQSKIVEIKTADLHKESERRHQTEAQFKRFIEATPEGIVAIDQNEYCTFINPKAAEILAHPDTNRLIGQKFHDICRPQDHLKRDLKKEDCPICQCIHLGKETYSDEHYFTTLKGDLVPVEIFASPVYQNDVLIGAILTFVDISLRKAHESELLKLSKAVEESPATTIITDQHGIIEYVNDRFSEVSGYTRKEAIGRRPNILKSGHTPDDVYKDMWATITKGKKWKGELLNRKKTGDLYWEETLISPITDNFGNITHFVSVKRDITEYKIAMDQVWHQANFDLLTDLPNRNLFEDRLETAVALAQREERSLALLFVDLDGFKSVNDNFGHEAGDYVLQQTAKRLKACLRHSDTAARLGGDEFVVILQDASNIQNIENVADKIITELAQATPYKEESLQVSASVGISIMPRDAQSANDLLRFADIAMYGAKQNGKNCFCHYNTFVMCAPADIPSE